MNNQSADKNGKLVAPLSEMIDLITESVDSGGEFRLITAGVSMKPLLRNRKDTVVLVKANKPLKKYDIPLYKRNDGRFVLHRVIGFKNGGYVMCGDNQTVKEYGIKDDNIIAVVSSIVRNGKTIDLNKSFFYKLYVFFWCRLFFVRCLLLKPRTLFYRVTARK